MKRAPRLTKRERKAIHGPGPSGINPNDDGAWHSSSGLRADGLSRCPECSVDGRVEVSCEQSTLTAQKHAEAIEMTGEEHMHMHCPSCGVEGVVGLPAEFGPPDDESFGPVQPFPDEDKVEHRDPDVDMDGPHAYAWIQGTKIRVSARNVDVNEVLDDAKQEALQKAIFVRMRQLGVRSGLFRLPL